MSIEIETRAGQHKLVQELNILLQYENDSAVLLDQIASNLSHQRIRDHILSFKQDAEDNIYDLWSSIQELEGKKNGIQNEPAYFKTASNPPSVYLSNQLSIFKILHSHQKIILSKYHFILELGANSFVKSRLKKAFRNNKDLSNYALNKIRQLQWGCK